MKKNPAQKPKINPCAYPTAIEMGATSLKLIQLNKGAHGYEIFRIAYQAGDSLGALITNNQVSGRIITSLPLSKIHSFTFIFPNMPEKDIEQAVLWKLKQNLPAGLDTGNISFDYLWYLSPVDNPNKEIMTVVFAAAKEAVTERIRQFAKFSLKVCAVVPEPYAVFCALNFLKKISPQETMLVLTLGSSESAISVIYRNYLCLVRPLSISGSGLTEAIATYHKLEPLKAEEIKRNEGLKINPPDSAAADSFCLPAVSSLLEGLVVDLEHTFKSFSHQLMKSQVVSYDRVILCGGSAAFKGLDEFLSQKLGVPVEAFNPLNDAREDAHSFAAAFGMAAGYTEANKLRRINLIPGELLKKPLLEAAGEFFNKNKKVRNILIIAGLAFFISAIQMLAVGILTLNLNLYNRRIQQAKVKLNRLQSQALEFEKQRNELAKEESVHKEKLQQLLSTSSSSKSYSELFEFIAGLAPQELWIKQFSVSEEQINIAGLTLNPQLIIQFMNQLDESGAFRDSFFSSTEKEAISNHTVYSFQISTTPIWDALKGQGINAGAAKKEG
ncbi:MAG: pilus assembly protein PilM [Candidatus Omnitrophota bacterium]